MAREFERQSATAFHDARRERLPFPLLGFDTDNDTVFMNETVRDYCAAEKIEFTRCRPYRKNEQAHVEQKNGEIVRRMAGYRRYEGLAAAAGQMATLYAPARLFVNAFQPCFKLAEKTCNGAQVKKRYHKPMTPCDRLLVDARVSTESRERIVELRADIDPVRLLAEIRSAQRALVSLADAADEALDHCIEIGAAGAARQLRRRPAHHLAGRRGSPDIAAEAESKARLTPPRPSRRRYG